MGGWSAADYTSVVKAVIAGDPGNSLLVQKLLGTQTEGGVMPPGGKLTDAEIQIIVDWINAGAPDN